AVAVDLQRSVQSRPLVGDLRAAELVAKEEAFLDGRVHALLQRLAEKEPALERVLGRDQVQPDLYTFQIAAASA
ncbi:MAG: hypothetical protein ACXVZK_13905, partial [Gaiellaceae bacterium]